MCLTLPQVLVTLMGIEKVLPAWQDLEVFLQLLPRSSTAERMNPYTSLWTGVRPGDGPQEFHLILLDGGRTDVLADEVGRAGAALHPLLGLPERLPGLRARRRPGLRVRLSRPDRRDPHAAAAAACDEAPSLPWASSLCGACYEVCPVKIDIPSILVHLRGRVVREEKSTLTPEALAMKGMAAAFGTRRRYEAAQRLARLGRGPLAKAAVPGWTAMRDLPEPPEGDLPRLVEAREPRPAPPARARRTSSSAKADILARVRDALGPVAGRARRSRAPTAPPARSPATGIVDLFCETRRRVPGDRAPRRRRRGRRHGPRHPRRGRRVGVPAGLPPTSACR